jgi:hypothetical protein
MYWGNSNLSSVPQKRSEKVVSMLARAPVSYSRQGTGELSVGGVGKDMRDFGSGFQGQWDAPRLLICNMPGDHLPKRAAAVDFDRITATRPDLTSAYVNHHTAYLAAQFSLQHVYEINCCSLDARLVRATVPHPSNALHSPIAVPTPSGSSRVVSSRSSRLFKNQKFEPSR